MHLNTSAEYANLDVALIHMRADGQADADIPDNVRITHRGHASWRQSATGQSRIHRQRGVLQQQHRYRCAARLPGGLGRGRGPATTKSLPFSDRTLVPRATLEAAAHVCPPHAARTAVSNAAARLWT
jgi:hypothetical protein